MSVRVIVSMFCFVAMMLAGIEANAQCTSTSTVNTPNACAQLVNSTSGGQGLYGEDDSGYGSGVWGYSSTGIGVTAGSVAGNALSAANNSAYNPAAYIINGNTNGIGVYGQGGSYGLFGQGSTSGVRGMSAVSTGVGVQGYNTNGGRGVYGDTQGAGGDAVWGQTTTGHGVVGEATTLGAIGVYGKGGGGATGYAGYFVGNVYISGTYGPSDERLKKNIIPIHDATDELLKLHGVTFEWKEPGNVFGRTGVQRGFIAQDVEKVHPEWVAQNEEGFKTVSVNQLEALEVESIRELKFQNDELKKRLDQLERGTTTSTPLFLLVLFGLLLVVYFFTWTSLGKKSR